MGCVLFDFSLATVVLIAITFYVFSLDYLPSTPPKARLGGLMERILFLEIFAWYVVFGWRLFPAQTAEA